MTDDDGKACPVWAVTLGSGRSYLAPINIQCWKRWFYTFYLFLLFICLFDINYIRNKIILLVKNQYRVTTRTQSIPYRRDFNDLTEIKVHFLTFQDIFGPFLDLSTPFRGPFRTRKSSQFLKPSQTLQTVSWPYRTL